MPCGVWTYGYGDATARVAIIDTTTGEHIDVCRGPLTDRTCPAVAGGPDAAVAGHRIRGDLCVASSSFCFDAAPSVTRCPLAWLVQNLTEALAD